MSSISPLPPWPRTPPAHGGVVLRRAREDDVAMARELATDPYIPTIGTLPPHADDAEALAWIRRQHARYDEGTGFSFAIAEAATDAAVGQCGLWLRELGEGRASAGYSIVPSARGRGFAADALAALTAFGWTVPGLHRISLYIEPWNAGSVRTAERAGYAREGLLRSHQAIGGVRRDMLLYAAVRALRVADAWRFRRGVWSRFRLIIDNFRKFRNESSIDSATCMTDRDDFRWRSLANSANGDRLPAFGIEIFRYFSETY